MHHIRTRPTVTVGPCQTRPYGPNANNCIKPKAISDEISARLRELNQPRNSFNELTLYIKSYWYNV